jgi:hypothetical protein
MKTLRDKLKSSKTDILRITLKIPSKIIIKHQAETKKLSKDSLEEIIYLYRRNNKDNQKR